MLCRMDDILKKAAVGKYGVAAPNAWNLETIKAAIEVAEELRSPIILDYGEGGYEENIFDHKSGPWGDFRGSCPGHNGRIHLHNGGQVQPAL